MVIQNLSDFIVQKVLNQRNWNSSHVKLAIISNNKFMNFQNRRAPGFIYRPNGSFQQNPSFSSHGQMNPSESQIGQQSYLLIDSLQDDVEEYFETIKDPEEEEVLSKKPINVQQKQQSYSLPVSPKSFQLQYLKRSETSKVEWAYDKNFRHNQKQSLSHKNKIATKSLEKKLSKQIPTKVCKNPQQPMINQEEENYYDPQSLPILPPEKQLAQPYFQYTYSQEPKEVLVEEKEQQIEQTAIIYQQKINDSKPKHSESLDIVKLLFENVFREKQSFQAFSQQLPQLDQQIKVFQPFKLVDFMPQSIIPSIPKFIKELLLLKHLQNCISLIVKKNKISKNHTNHSSVSSKILQEIKQVTQELQKIQIYQGIEGIFTSNSKMQQIKRFLVFERFSIIVIVYITVIGKFQEYKIYLLNLIKFLIENHLVLLNNIIVSRPLASIIQQHYPLLAKKSLDLIKVNNDSINEVILKLSVVDDLFFSSLNKLGKRTATFTFGQIFKEFLEFLAFYLHKNALQTKANTFSTAPSLFLKLNPSQYHLIIDATQFLIKDKKGGFSFRPFHQNFLKQMSEHYQIINYSSLDPKQSKSLLSKFDKHNLIKHNLYSHHFETWPQFRRCLQKITFDVKNLIYLNCEQNQTDLERSINLKKWKGDKKDRQLTEISPILISIPYMKLDCEKVAQALKHCHSDIGKMQETLLPMLKKANNQQ